ncbi:MAG: hypothetical protein ACREYB_04195 [Casimicrobiaceae bacterium]
MSDGPVATPRQRGHEVADVDWRRIALTAAGLAAVLIVVALAAMAVHALLRPAPSGEPSAVPAMATGPRLQSAPALDLQALRREKQTMLNEYRWLDRPKGTLRIPIGQAMQLTAERHAATQGDREKRTEAAR